ncbi:hypothetical protein BDW74DRAFT_92382 [Aspergillus multicolor]|uniref:uncharacterized protein n=1 Tax=Aspergillus multicolor TaxID=41759 RepID=UPI003CCCF174
MIRRQRYLTMASPVSSSTPSLRTRIFLSLSSYFPHFFLPRSDVMPFLVTESAVSVRWFHFWLWFPIFCSLSPNASVSSSWCFLFLMGDVIYLQSDVNKRPLVYSVVCACFYRILRKTSRWK